MKLLLAIAAALALTALWLDSRAAVPCDAQAGQMQPPKLNRLDIIERRLEQLEKRIEDHEKRLTPTPAAKPERKRSYPYPTDPRSMKQIQREDPELYHDIITTIPAG